jgi:hypothetical protein
MANMRPLAMAVVGFVFLILIFAGITYLQLALLGLSLMVWVPIVLGFLWQGHKARSFWIPTDSSAPKDMPNPEASMVNIEGRSFRVQSMPPRLQFTVRLRNMYLLAAISVIAAGSLFASLVGSSVLSPTLDTDNARYYEMYILCYLLVILIFPALVWLSESALIRRPGITLASLQATTRGGLGTRWIGYRFVDTTGRYHGGSVIDFGGPKNDDFKVVFCSPLNPGFNRLSCGLLFHKVSWAEG